MTMKLLHRIHTWQRWLWPFVLAVLLVLAARPLLDRLAAADTIVTATAVGTSIVDGYEQVYIDDSQGQRTYITEGARNRRQPVLDGDWVAYLEHINGMAQVMLYHIPSRAVTQLSDGTSANRRISLDDGRVVWSKWMPNERWHIHYYDGATVSRVSAGATSVRPDIAGNYITYASKLNNGNWRAFRYNITTGATTALGTGDQYAWPRLADEAGDVLFGFLGL